MDVRFINVRISMNLPFIHLSNSKVPVQISNSTVDASNILQVDKTRATIQGA